MAKIGGWVCSYRKIWENDFFHGNGMRIAIWDWILHHTAFSETPHSIAGVKVTLQRGDVCFSQSQICKDTGATRKQVRDVIDYLVSTGAMVKIRANERANGGANVRANARSIYRIENYDKYQGAESEGANERAKARATKGPTKEQVITNTTIPVGTDQKIDPVKVMFDQGINLLAQSGIEERKARSLLGKWRKEQGASSVIEALGKAQREGAIDPVSFIEGCFRYKKKKAPTSSSERLRKIVGGMY